jgi:uncharacterized protein YggE
MPTPYGPRFLRALFANALPLVLILGVAGTYSGSARAQADASVRSISVAGEAERRVAPDMAELRVEVVTEGENAADARAEADGITTRALAVLRGAGISDRDIDTTGLSVSPQFRWLKEEGRQQLTGYRVSRSIELRLLELDRLGDVLIQLNDAGINQMQTPRLGLQNEEMVYQEVLAAAAENARVRAQTVAEALGEELGAVLSVSTQREPAPRPMAMERVMMAADTAAPSPADSYASAYLRYRVSLNASFMLQ